jgi:hypothetical protein
MNPVVIEFLTTLLRYLLYPVMAWAVAKGIFSQAAADSYLSYFIAWLIPVAWAAFVVWRKRQKLLVALSQPPTTEAHVDAMLKEARQEGVMPDLVPSVTTAKTERPMPKAWTDAVWPPKDAA